MNIGFLKKEIFRIRSLLGLKQEVFGNEKDILKEYQNIILLSKKTSPHLYTFNSNSGGKAKKRKPLLLLLFGQSNALGVNNNNPSMPTNEILNHPGKMWWFAGGSPYYSGAGSASSSGSIGNEFITTNVITTNAERAPIGISLQRRLMDAGYEVAYVLVAEGSTTLYSDWAAPPNSGAKNLIAKLDNELTQATNHSTFPIDQEYKTVLLWIQGESDASSELHSLNYESRLLNFIAWIEQKTWCKSPHWLICRLNVNNGRTYVSTVRETQENVSNFITNSTLIDLDPFPLNPDLDHYNVTQRIAIGDMLNSIIQSLED